MGKSCTGGSLECLMLSILSGSQLASERLCISTPLVTSQLALASASSCPPGSPRCLLLPRERSEGPQGTASSATDLMDFVTVGVVLARPREACSCASLCGESSRTSLAADAHREQGWAELTVWLLSGF